MIDHLIRVLEPLGEDDMDESMEGVTTSPE
jgi:hypothetical protein